MANTVGKQRRIVPVGRPFQKGQSGNPNGRPKGSRNWSTTVRRLLDDAELLDMVVAHSLDKGGKPVQFPKWWPAMTDKTYGELIAMAMIFKASQGNTDAAHWLKTTGWGTNLEIEDDSGSDIANILDDLDDVDTQRQSLADEAERALNEQHGDSPEN